MKSRNFASFFATAAMVMATAFSAASATAGDGNVAFTANINTVEFLVPNGECLSGMGSVGAGAGRSNLYGRKLDSPSNAVLLSMNDCVLPSATGLNFGGGKFTMTGLSGDKIYAEFDGVLVYQSGDPAATAVYAFVPDQTRFRITGGTGRYLRAGGNGTISGTETVNSKEGTSKGVLNATGTIIY